MRDGYLRQVSVAKHQIELKFENTQPIHTAQFRTEPKDYEFERSLKAETAKM